MTKKPAAIPLFADAYLADTMHLTLEEHGAYLNLMMIAWRNDDCTLPDDDHRLARMLGISKRKWTSLKEVVMQFWTLENGKYEQKRLSKERNWVNEKSRINSENRTRKNEQDIENKQSGGKGRGNDRGTARTTPPPPPPPVDVNDKSSTSTDAADVFDVVEFADRCARSAGVRNIDPGRIVQHNKIIREWMELGASEQDILTVIAAGVGAAKEPIRSMNYFDAAIRQHVAKRGATVNGSGTTHKPPPRPVAAKDSEDETGIKIKGALRKSLGHDLFSQWFEPVAILTADDQITCVCPSQFHIDWIADRYVGKLAAAANVDPQSIIFETETEQ